MSCGRQADTPLALRCGAELLGAFLPFFSVGFNVLSGAALFGGLSLATTLPRRHVSWDSSRECRILWCLQVIPPS